MKVQRGRANKGVDLSQWIGKWEHLAVLFLWGRIVNIKNKENTYRSLLLYEHIKIKLKISFKDMNFMDK